jgi:hypothetical protein
MRLLCGETFLLMTRVVGSLAGEPVVRAERCQAGAAEQAARGRDLPARLRAVKGGARSPVRSSNVGEEVPRRLGGGRLGAWLADVHALGPLAATPDSGFIKQRASQRLQKLLDCTQS